MVKINILRWLRLFFASTLLTGLMGDPSHREKSFRNHSRRLQFPGSEKMQTALFLILYLPKDDETTFYQSLTVQVVFYELRRRKGKFRQDI
ncbi:MAG: hypothetical protein IPG53_09105 [Ignavibacteriales bacterium]|nr:hypothetical protein [Ignavibacteriales bacterium]